MQYHFQLNINAKKDYYHIFADAGKSTENTKETGLPNCELLIANGKVKYNQIGKTWNCQLCNYIRTKYEWKQVAHHANKHKFNSY